MCVRCSATNGVTSSIAKISRRNSGRHSAPMFSTWWGASLRTNASSPGISTMNRATPAHMRRCCRWSRRCLNGHARHSQINRSPPVRGSSTMADGNVLLIESANEVSLEEIKSAHLPTAETGETDWIMPETLEFFWQMGRRAAVLGYVTRRTRTARRLPAAVPAA